MKKSGYKILISIFIVTLIIIVSFTVILKPLSPFVFNSAEYLDKYRPEAVHEICSTLNIHPTNTFCANPYDQDADSLILLIEQTFPYESMYTDLTSRIEIWNPVAGGCNGQVIYGFCPSPATCTSSNTYLCSYDISFTEVSVQLNVRIRRNGGTITDYLILEYNES